MEHVVVVDPTGSPLATVPKAQAHGPHTPLHLAFSCHVVRSDGRLLLTRRSTAKRTWPGVWSNACCGHPQAGESLRAAVERRLREELGLRATRLALAVPDFAYRAEMADGTVEHELCPVVVAEVDGPVVLDPAEADDARWTSWAELQRRAASDPASLSPWSVAQVGELGRLGDDPRAWLDVATPIDAATSVSAVATGDPLAVAGGALDGILDAFLTARSAELRALDTRLDELTGEIGALVRTGGKRLRPAFVYWGHRATGAGHHDGVLHAAAAVEMLHTFALLHDDVMDRSVRRRGRPTAHVALGAQHARSARTGDSAWFGTSAAVLAGDLAHVWAEELIGGLPFEADAVARARAVFDVLRNEVTAGQFLDLLVAGEPRATEADARNVALLKSARYSVTRPLLLGAALATPAPPPALAAYGDAVGVAFQLRDDVLGLFGDPDVTGKGAADDLREGKRTLLVLRSLRLADDRGRAVLRGALGDPDLDDAGACRAREVVASSGALASVEALIAAEHARAVRALDHLPEPSRSALRTLADRAVRRRR